MKVDILLRTRDYDRDYRWIFKPEYVDQVTEERMSFLIQMMQKSELKQYLERESLCNIYYLYDENGSVLVRSGFSGSMDRQGRNIYAVEGIACPAEMNRLFWYALPYLVDWLLQRPMLREKWMQENHIEEHAAREYQIEVEGLTEDMIFDSSAEENQMWKRMKDHSDCMRRLYEDVGQAAEMYSFIYGTRSKSFYDSQAIRCYTPETFGSLESVCSYKEMTAPKPIIKEEERIYRAEIQIEKRNRRYAAYFQAVDDAGESIAETEAMTFGNDGIGMAQIERARIALEQKIAPLGYRRGRRERKS